MAIESRKSAALYSTAEHQLSPGSMFAHKPTGKLIGQTWILKFVGFT